MGPKGSNVQAITQDYDVSIKFPDREKASNSSTVPNGEGVGSGDGDTPKINGEDGNEEPPTAVDPRHVIVITGRQENAEAAKQAFDGKCFAWYGHGALVCVHLSNHTLHAYIVCMCVV